MLETLDVTWKIDKKKEILKTCTEYVAKVEAYLDQSEWDHKVTQKHNFQFNLSLSLS